MSISHIARWTAIAVVSCMLGYGTAQAAPIAATIEFEASGFSAVFSPPGTPPQDSVSGRFTFTFNDAGGDQLGIVPETVNLMIAGFAYFKGNTAVDVFLTGAVPDILFYATVSGGTVVFPENDFLLVVDLPLASPSLAVFVYATPLFNDAFQTHTGTVTASIASVPEPGTLWLLGTGLAGLAGLTRRRGPRSNRQQP